VTLPRIFPSEDRGVLTIVGASLKKPLTSFLGNHKKWVTGAFLKGVVLKDGKVVVSLLGAGRPGNKEWNMW